MSCGVPCISYKTPGIEDLIIHNETGIIVDEFDVNHMARAIIRLLTDNALYTKLKVKCVEHMQQFSWEKTLSMLEQIFNR
jgi:glycosyltransferase involved in cell wall biosynthesis